MGFVREFREFAVKGNVVDMAVGIIIGAAFGKIVSSLVSDVVTPPLGYLIGGVAFVEVVFSWPGIGNLLFLSIGQRDYPVILGVMLFVSVIFVLLNLTVDLMHAALDPRVRTSIST
mgnify:CR=1 FL=1